MDFEQPAERRVFWHNMENPEQNFGIMAVESRIKTIDGRTDDWPDFPEQTRKPFVRAAADASYFYLLAYLPDVDLKKHKSSSPRYLSKQKGVINCHFVEKLLMGLEFYRYFF